MPVRPLVRTIQTCRKVQRMQTAILRNSEILAKPRKTSQNYENNLCLMLPADSRVLLVSENSGNCRKANLRP